mgnify:CR=1 FL=1
MFKLALSFYNTNTNSFKQIKADKTADTQSQIDQLNSATSVTIFCKNAEQMIEAKAQLSQMRASAEQSDVLNSFNGDLVSDDTSMTVRLEREPSRSFSIEDVLSLASSSVQ